MPKTSIADYSQTAADNSDIGGINIAEGCAPGNLNNAEREQMAHLAAYYANDGQKFTGDVGIGVSPPTARLHVVTTTAGDTAVRLDGVAGRITVDLSGLGTNYHDGAAHQYRTYAGTVYGIVQSSGWKLGGQGGGTSGGLSGVHEMEAATSGFWAALVTHTTSGTPQGIGIKYTAAAPNGAGSQFLFGADSSATRFALLSNGGLSNYSANNVNLSDIATKDEETLRDFDADVARERFLQIPVVLYKYKDQTHGDFNFGTIAQGVETLFPSLVDDSSPDGLKRVYEYDIFWMAVGMVQDAQRRIADLESRLAAAGL